MSTENTQKIINKIHNNEFDLAHLLELLNDKRGIIRANVLFALPNKFGESDDFIVQALTSAATNNYSTFRLMGNVTQKKLSIATLEWMKNDLAKKTYYSLIADCDSVEIKDIDRLVQQGPMKI